MRWFRKDEKRIEMLIAPEHLTILEETAVKLGGGLDKVVAHSLSLYLALQKYQGEGYTEIVLRNPQKKIEKTIRI